MKISNQTNLNLIIGDGLNHSQSPLLHNAIYQLENIDIVFLAKSHSNLNLLIQFIKTFPVSLTAVTMPFKKTILTFLDDASPEVKTLGAANTIINQQGKLIGYNTDVDGVAFALREVSLAKKTILIIGAGGAAAALGYYLKEKSAKLIWLNRTQSKAKGMANLFGGEVIDNIQEAKAIDIVINTTPIGMNPRINQSFLEHFQFSKDHIVFDMVYNPIITPLLKRARANNAKIISGLDMFIAQGIKQIELLTNKTLFKPLLFMSVKKILEQNQRELNP